MRRREDFDEFFRDLLPRARSVAARIVGPADADDAVAEAFARALARWRHVGGLPYRDAWVLRVTANAAVDMTRRRRPEPLAAAATSSLEDSVDRIALAAALRALAPRQREIIALRYLAGLSIDEVAEVLRISVNTVKTHTSRGMDSLRLALGDWKEEPRWQ